MLLMFTRFILASGWCSVFTTFGINSITVWVQNTAHSLGMRNNLFSRRVQYVQDDEPDDVPKSQQKCEEPCGSKESVQLY